MKKVFLTRYILEFDDLLGTRSHGYQTKIQHLRFQVQEKFGSDDSAVGFQENRFLLPVGTFDPI